jgi:hypothetical protein
MKHTLILTRSCGPGLLLVVALGCRHSLPPQADREAARQALCTALNAWQNGETAEALQKRSPPIYITDLDWRAGRRLQSYQLSEKDEYHGVQLRCSVVLKLKDAQNKLQEKSVTYLIDTSPAFVIVPGDF